MHPAPRLLTIIAAALTVLALPAGASAKKAAKDPHRLPAQWQHRYHVTSAKADPDGDGLTNWTEYRAKTSPRKLDTDRDGIDDDAEDRDRDGLDNASEQRANTDPASRDSDHDGKADAREDSDRDGLPNGAEEDTANDPADPDTDGDGIKDGDENAGRVVSFDGETLVLKLAATGKVVSAPLADDSAVECNATDDYEGDFQDDTSDDPADDSADVEDDPSADGSDDVLAAAAVIRGEDDGYSSADYETDVPEVDDSDTADTEDTSCASDTLDTGAWVHEAELSNGDAGLQFDSVLLVEDE